MEHHLTTYITHDTLISALGFGTQENLEAIRSYHSGITLQTDKRIADTPLLAATLSQERLQQQAEAIGVSGYPRMEQLFILTINELIRQSGQTLEDKPADSSSPPPKGTSIYWPVIRNIPMKRSFFGKWQKTLPVISMPRNGCMSFPMPAFQECQPHSRKTHDRERNLPPGNRSGR
mgnify:CR=1 FL=1